ncbi:MAG: ABC transporter permease subunit [Bdellovibrionota bacterium]
MLKLNPQTRRKLQRFKSVKRAYYSLMLFSFSLILAIFAECWVNNRALVVHYQGEYYFPTYRSMIPGHVFGFDYAYEANYRELRNRFVQEANQDNWLIMPLVPYNEYENDLKGHTDENGNRIYPPYAPSFAEQHYLGTDVVGRDIVARLVYGFRYCIAFSLVLLLFNYSIGVSLGCVMGYWGGWFDLLFQRIIEIWSNVPFLYIIIIVASVIPPTFAILVGISVFFGWMGMTWYLRTITYKEKAREYVLAARALGASNFRVLFTHILPNSISLIITFVPFAVIGGITSLTSLDYLGFGLPAPTPSWGELLAQGTSHLEAPWIVWSVIVGTVFILTMITFVGEGVREAFDPKRHTTYE